MEAFAIRFVEDLIGRLSGPFAFRFVFQPATAVFYAVRDGVKDAREGRSPYLSTILFHPAERRARLHEGWKATLRVLLLGAIMELAYQLLVFGRPRPIELVLIVFGLVFLPYLLLRGIVTRVASRWVKRCDV